MGVLADSTPSGVCSNSSCLLARRQQFAVLKRKRHRPRLDRLDQLFSTALRRIWPRWSNVLVIVKPETVVGWQDRHLVRDVAS